MRADIRPRLAEAVELAFKTAQGMLIIALETDDAAKSRHHCGRRTNHCFETGQAPRGIPRMKLSSRLIMPVRVRLSFEPPNPSLFSFNSPQGMCPECSGLGESYTFDPALLVPDESLSFKQGCVAQWSRGKKSDVGAGTFIKESPIRLNVKKAGKPHTAGNAMA